MFKRFGGRTSCHVQQIAAARQLHFRYSTVPRPGGDLSIFSLSGDRFDLLVYNAAATRYALRAYDTSGDGTGRLSAEQALSDFKEALLGRLSARCREFPSVEAFVQLSAAEYDEYPIGISPRYNRAQVDLDGDGSYETILHFISGVHCGSGGCRTYVFEPEGDRARLISEIFISRPPIIVTPTVSRGWRSLAVWVSGGSERRRFAELPFDGESYPDNPTMSPARALSQSPPPGEIVIGSDEDAIIVAGGR